MCAPFHFPRGLPAGLSPATNPSPPRLSREREHPPRFAQPGTFEFEYSSRWKALDEMEKQQRDQVERNIREAKEKLEQEMEAAKHEHQLMMMRQGTPIQRNLSHTEEDTHFSRTKLTCYLLCCAHIQH